ncbi:MAG: ComEC/Rec2 family competence protein, partial [Actinomycetia bacterium]|nr:ComEC/Rec2 family competence protein [Actinomycetes bacterium]
FRFFYNPWIILAVGAAFVTLFKLSLHFKNRFYRLNFGVANMPAFFQGFIGIQFGINIGNVFPISAAYFGGISLTGIYANWVAIPLIGVIVQLGFIAGIFGIFSTKLALVLNASNFLFCKFFLAMAHFFDVYFEYPKVPQPPAWGLGLYYAFVGFMIFQSTLKAKAQSVYFNLQRLWEYED